VSVSTPVRIFVLHLVWTLLFTLGAGWWAIREVDSSYAASAERWREAIETLPAENTLQPMAAEIARTLLLLDDPSIPAEVQESRRNGISGGLRIVVDALDVVDALFVLDRELRIVYTSDLDWIDLAYTKPEWREMFATTGTLRKVLGEGEAKRTWSVVPVYDSSGADRVRLGALAVVYRADRGLWERVPLTEPPKVDTIDITLPLVLFVVGVALGGLGLAVFSVAPVRRLERAVDEFRRRGFRGGIDAGRLGGRSELAATVRAINELGGELEALDRRGREREGLLATLSLALEDGMIAVGSDGTPKTWNRAALRILTARDGGATAGHVPEDTSGAVETALFRNPTLADLAPDGTRRSRELSLQLADGTEAPAKVTCLPFESGPGEFGRLILIRDLAALRRVETHLLESSRYAVLAHLAAGLAHEIRNPLHSIGINAGVVETYVHRPPDDRTRRAMSESLRSVQDETRRLGDLLNNYLGMVRPDQGPQAVDLRDLARKVVQLLGSTASSGGVHLILGGEESLPLVQGTSDRLQQAILNLALNGIQATPRGGEVRIETAHAGDHVEVRVSDTGPGVPEDLRDRLFGIRVTTKPGGSGLGLPLVRLIAESHGGSIRYEPCEGERGARFTLSLPVVRAA
jgi:signal transduction histidine kinase